MPVRHRHTRHTRARLGNGTGQGSKAIVTLSRQGSSSPFVSSRVVLSCHVTSRRFSSRVLPSCDIQFTMSQRLCYTVQRTEYSIDTLCVATANPAARGVVLPSLVRFPAQALSNLRSSVRSQESASRQDHKIQYSCKQTMARRGVWLEPNPANLQAAWVVTTRPDNSRGSKQSKVQSPKSDSQPRLSIRAGGRGGQGLHPSCRPRLVGNPPTARATIAVGRLCLLVQLPAGTGGDAIISISSCLARGNGHFDWAALDGAAH